MPGKCLQGLISTHPRILDPGVAICLTGFVAEGLCHPQLRPELDVVLLLRHLDRLLQSLPDVQRALLVDEAEM